MFDPVDVMGLLGLLALAAPVVLLAVLGAASLLDRRLGELSTGRACVATCAAGLLAAAAVLALMLAYDTRHVPLEVGNWVHVGDYHFSIKLVYDRLSVPLVLMTFLLCGVIAAFATRYMHREHGYNRFFTLFALFLAGMVLTSVAGTIETLFTGWELVGLSSALLVAFFQERPAPTRNGLRVWTVYRVSDAALLLAAVFMHRLTGEGDFERLLGTQPWPEGVVAESVTPRSAAVVGALLLVAAAGKSALVPFSGWLPRAMEGPTPSSAVFYGALSVHLGAYLLLRMGPILEASPALSAAVVALGLATAVYAYLTEGVQTDIKSVLAFASLAQVGLIVAEIGLGLRYVPLAHLLGHACLRTLQFIRAPSLLHDYHQLENALGEHLPPSRGLLSRVARSPFGARLYRFGLERGHLDTLLNRFVVAPFVGVFRWCDALERRWTDLLAGRPSRPAAKPAPSVRMDDLP
jgi:NAD(P)H-quinone oxidoreductase subunit 5